MEADNDVVMVLKPYDEHFTREHEGRTIDYNNAIIEDGVVKPYILTNGGKYPKDVRIAGTNYSDEKKLEVVATYLACQSQVETSKITGVPVPTIRSFMKTKWWEPACSKVRTLDKSKKLTKLSRIVNKALDLIEDRITDGDYLYDQKTGEVKRVPMSAKNSISAANGLIDRFLLLNKSFEEQVEAKDSGDKLSQLADAFAKFTKTKNPLVEDAPIDATFTEVKDDD
jgi:hypothetical protein